MRYPKALVAALLFCLCSVGAARAGTFVLPTGEKVTVISMGPVTFAHAPPGLMLRYRSNVEIHDRAALHAEALQVWRVFQLNAEEGGYGSAVVSAMGPASAGFNFVFEKHGGLWSEDGVRPATLSGGTRKLAWTLGTWHCTETFAQEDNKVQYRVTGINQVDPTGTIIWANSIFHSPIGTMYSFSDTGYDAKRKVWFAVEHRANVTQRTETAESNSRSTQSFGSVTIGGYPPIYFRATDLISADGSVIQQHGDVQIKGVWRPFDRSTCSRSNATPPPDIDNDPSI
jgi:hypothetical protein